MNYQSIHDNIIYRAKRRNLTLERCESHHIIPKCEGGLESGDQVFLTQKEHRIIHYLRYKITHVLGNKLAYNLMRYGRDGLIENHIEIARLGGKAHHSIWRNKNPISYRERQSISGKIGGKKCKDDKLGFFSMSDEERKKLRDKGRNTTVKNKLGMFSDEYREKHKQLLFKKVNTPDGVFNSLTEAAQYYNITRGTMTYRIKSENYKEWYLMDKGE